jgi:hypothetical protein
MECGEDRGSSELVARAMAEIGWSVDRPRESCNTPVH